MELVLSAIAAGGLVGASDQYMCLLIVALASRLGWITLTPTLSFMGSWWFILIVVVFWLLTVAPAFASVLSPGVLHAVNTVVNFLSGFVVPASSALIGLASVGVIASLNPDLRHVLETLRIFDAQGHLAATGAVVAAGSGITALVLTGSKGLAKPALSISTGTVGTASAPIFATVENVASVVLMALAYELCRVNPWLIVALLAVVIVAVAALLIFALYQLRRLKKGLGRVLYLAQIHPRAGLAVALEFLVWGSGWLIWKVWGRGFIMLAVWVVWVGLFITLPPAVGVFFMVFPPVSPVAAAVSGLVLIGIFLGVGVSSARALLKELEKEPLPAKPQQAGQTA
jgi:hypothetical protein